MTDKEKYWLDETDPRELRRRADDLEKDGFLAMAHELRRRAWLHERSPQEAP